MASGVRAIRYNFELHKMRLKHEFIESVCPIFCYENMKERLQKVKAPNPPAFLDPLNSLNTCYYYTVPRFLHHLHPSNLWLISRIRANDSDAVRRKFEISPDFLRGKYFQVLDDPALYFKEGKMDSPMYHCKCVLYLTALGISLYMRAREVTELLLSLTETDGQGIADANEVQYASHIMSLNDGDFHAFPAFLVAIRREFFTAISPLLAAGWQSGEAMALPIRRRYERRALYFRDWLDIALHMLASRSFYPIHRLVASVIGSTEYRSSRLPLSLVISHRNNATPTPFGLIDVEHLSPDLRMIGVPNLLDLADQYDQYKQLKVTLQAVKELKRQAEVDGVNPQLMMQAAMDPKTKDNRNNNARIQQASNSSGKKSKLNVSDWYCSEPLRILLFALERKRSLAQCIQAFEVYIRAKFFFNAEELKLQDPRARDQRNIANCLLNLACREQDAIDALLRRVRTGRRRFAHVEVHKVLESRRDQHAAIIERLTDCLLHTLLQAKQLVRFFHSSQKKPVYSPGSVDFQLARQASLIMPSIRFGLVTAFNETRDAWSYLSLDMMRLVAKDSALLLHFQVGRRPKLQEMGEEANNKEATKSFKGKKKI